MSFETTPSQEEIEKIFSKYYLEQYIPKGGTEGYPECTPTPTNYAPKPITIEEFKRRTSAKPAPQEINTPKKTKRGGKKLRLKNEKRDIRRLMGIVSGEEKRQLYKKLRQLEQWAKPSPKKNKK